MEGSYVQRTGAGALPGHPEPANLADILERVLDRGLVVVGDIRVNLLDIELLTIKLRLVIASLQTAKQVGMNWWERDPWFTGDDHELRQENERLRARLAEVESQTGRRAIEGGRRPRVNREPAKREPAKREPAKREPAKRQPAKRVRRSKGGEGRDG
jgi:hypothetical protein